MQNHTDYVYLTERSKNYVFRRHIRPVEVQPYFGGKKYFLRTLGTSNLKDARRRAFDFERYTDAKLREATEALQKDPLSRIRDLWNDLADYASPVPEPITILQPTLPRLTIEDFKDGLRRWARHECERLEAISIETPPLNDDGRRERLHAIDRSKVRLRDAFSLPALLAPTTPAHVAELIVAMLGTVGCHVAHEDGLLRRFWRTAVALALAVLDGEETLRLDVHADPEGLVGHIRETADELLGATSPSQSPAVTIVAPVPPSASTKIWRLDTVLSDYMRTYKGASEAADDVRLYARRFREVNGDLLLEEFTRDHVLAFQAALGQLPARLPVRDRKLTLPQIVAKHASVQTRRLAFSSIEKHHQMLSSVFAHATKTLRIIPFNPFERSHPVGPRYTKPPRRSLTEAEVAVLLNSPIYEGCLSVSGPSTRTKKGRLIVRDGIYWMPLLSLHMGLRIEEIAGLLVSDIVERHGIPAISVSPFDSAGNIVKHIKNGSSIRTVPIHDALIDMGFLDYARRQTAERVFPELRLCKKKRWGSKLSKDLGKVMNHLDLSDPMITVHSFRHNFRDQLREIGPSDEDSKRIMGHKVRGAHAGYGSAESMTRWKTIINRVSYASSTPLKRQDRSDLASSTVP